MSAAHLRATVVTMRISVCRALSRKVCCGNAMSAGFNSRNPARDRRKAHWGQQLCCEPQRLLRRSPSGLRVVAPKDIARTQPRLRRPAPELIQPTVRTVPVRADGALAAKALDGSATPRGASTAARSSFCGGY